MCTEVFKNQHLQDKKLHHLQSSKFIGELHNLSHIYSIFKYIKRDWTNLKLYAHVIIGEFRARRISASRDCFQVPKRIVDIIFTNTFLLLLILFSFFLFGPIINVVVTVIMLPSFTVYVIFFFLCRRNRRERGSRC